MALFCSSIIYCKDHNVFELKYISFLFCTENLFRQYFLVAKVDLLDMEVVVYFFSQNKWCNITYHKSAVHSNL